MIERIVENWLTNVNEKSFQIPFCQLLISEGYKVVHLSRHSSFEEGKDIIAVDPNGIPCAFQLKDAKGRKIAQTDWEKYIAQIIRLVEIPIKHPSINGNVPRKVYFVTNGELSEEVRHEILGRNSDWKNRNLPELETIVIGDLLLRFSTIHNNLWPFNLNTEKELLEFFLSNGKGYLDKGHFAEFIETLSSRRIEERNKNWKRLLASLAIFTSYALTPYEKEHNHVALIEGWTIFLANAISIIEKNALKRPLWQNTIDIAKNVIEQSLSDLWDEIKDLKIFSVGDVLVDGSFYRGRITWLCGLVSSLLLIKREKKTLKDDDLPVYTDFLLANQKSLYLWGEAAIPQLLANCWAFNVLGVTHLSDRLIFYLLTAIIEKSSSPQGIPDPYHHLGEVILSISGLSESLAEENFSGRTYTLNSLIQLICIRGFRGALEDLWKQISYLRFVEFEPLDCSQNCRWQCENTGTLYDSSPQTTQSWADLAHQSKKINLKKIPDFFIKNPSYLLLFIIVYPHRLRSDIVKLLDKSFNQSANYTFVS